MKYRRFICDFECTIDTTKVICWLWKALDYDSYQMHTGYDIDSFLDFVRANDNSDYYFHNLAYDGSFIISKLLAENVKHNTSDVTETEHFVPTIQGSVERFTYYYNEKNWSNFFDTTALLNGSLKELGKTVGMTKGDTQTEAMYTNDELETLTAEQLKRAEDYCEQDVKILHKVCKTFQLLELMQIAQTKARLAYLCFTEFDVSSDSYTFRPANKIPKPKFDVPTIKVKETIIHFIYTFNGKQRLVQMPEYEFITKGKSTKQRYKEYNRTIETIEVPEYCLLSEKTYSNRQEYYKDVSKKLEYDERFVYYTNVDVPYRQKYSKRKYGKDLYKLTEHVDRELITAVNSQVQTSYKGGLNYTEPRKANFWIDLPVYVYDINSMYPWIYSTKPMPDTSTARRIPYEQLQKDDLAFIVFKHGLEAECKPDKMPLIKLKTDANTTGINAALYHKDFKHTGHMTLTNIEFQYLLENYTIKHGLVNRQGVPLVEVIYFDRNYRLEKAFSAYAEYWYSEKLNAEKNNDAVRRMFAKLMLNSLYGKFGQFETVYESFMYQIDAKTGAIIKGSSRDYTSSLTDADVPVASYITAYGRCYLADAINAVGLDRFLYCDTDSLHVVGSAEDLIPVGDKLGEYKLEGISKRSKFIQTKTYGEYYYIPDNYKGDASKLKTGWKTVCAGFTDQIPMDEFNAGLSTTVLRSVQTDGGVHLKPTPITLGAKFGDFSNGMDSKRNEMISKATKLDEIEFQTRVYPERDKLLQELSNSFKNLH